MKFLFLALLVTTSLFADDSKLCDYLKVNTFQAYSLKALQWNAPLSVSDLTKKVSPEVSKEVADLCSKGSLNLKQIAESCSHKCALHGVTQYRYFANGVSSGMVPLNSKTKRCQELCKGHEQYAYAFQDGLKAKGARTDCTEAVTRSDRGNTKSDLNKTFRNIAKEATTKQ